MKSFNTTATESPDLEPAHGAHPRGVRGARSRAAAAAAASLALLLPASLAGVSAGAGPRIATAAEREALLERLEKILPGGDRAAFLAGLAGVENPLLPPADDGGGDTTTPPPPPPPPPAELTPEEVLAAAAAHVGRPAVLISPQRRVIVLAGGRSVAEGESFSVAFPDGATRAVELVVVERKSFVLGFGGVRHTVSTRPAQGEDGAISRD